MITGKENLRDKYQAAKLTKVWKGWIADMPYLEPEGQNYYAALLGIVLDKYQSLLEVHIKEVPISFFDNIEPSKYYIKSTHEERIPLSLDSLREQEQIHPIVVSRTEVGGSWVIVDGLKRLEGLQELGAKKALVKFVTIPESQEQVLHHQLNIPLSELPPEIIDEYLTEQFENEIAAMKEKDAKRKEERGKVK